MVAFTKEDIETITFISNEDTLVFLPFEETWKLDIPKEVPLDEAKVSATATNVLTLSPSRILTKDIDLSAFGLDTPYSLPLSTEAFMTLTTAIPSFYIDTFVEDYATDLTP